MNKLAVMLISLFTANAYAADLAQTYQEAAANNGTYQAAAASYKAASYGVPIARANFFPSLALAADTTGNRQSPAEPRDYNSNGFTFTATQALLNVGDWFTYSQAEATYKQAAVTFGQALQTLITSTASDYFGVLDAEEQLKYAEANQASLKEQLVQTKAQYKVGLKALTDVQLTEANYASAVASTVAAENTLNNAKQTLSALTGQPISKLAPLKEDFPLVKPSPADPQAWINAGLKNNLALQSAALQSEIDKLGIKVDATTGYIPTVSAVGTYANTKSNNAMPAPDYRSTASSAALQLSWNIFNGGSTAATVKQDEYTYQADVANQEQTIRETTTGVEEAYLNVLSDISQIQAYHQAVISGETSLKAIRAGYLVGTRTIVDVLTAQSNLFQSQQQYATAIYSYINDSLNLKLQAGTLAPQDITAINGWLVQEAQTKALKTEATDSSKAPINTATPSPATTIKSNS